MDQGHKLTEKELAALESRIARVYQDSAKDLQKKVDQYFASFVQRDKKQLELLKAGKITEEQYRQWRLSQIGRGKRFEALRDQVAERMTEANKVALSYVNDTTPGIYSLNHNYAAYTIEQVSGDVGFTIWDERTVKNLVAEDPTLLPKRRVNAPKDLKWNKRQFTAEITAGIIQGEAIGKIANRVQNLSDANRSGAIRNARTAVTGAQNAGRQASYNQAKEMGLQLRKRWIATKDNRTRHAHAMLDGQTVELDKPFEIEGQKLMFPGDPTGLARLVWNCRCTMRTVEKEGIEAEPRQMRVRDPEAGRNVLVEEMTYDEWLNRKKGKKKIENPLKSDIKKVEAKANEREPILSKEKVVERAKAFADKINANPALLDNGYGGYSAIRCFINSELGYDGLPKVLNAADFEAYAQGKTVLYRGVQGNGDKSAKDVVDEFKYGKLWANNSGQAIFGRGVYFAKDESIAQTSYAGSGGEVISSVLSSDARIADYATLYKEFMETGIPKIIGEAKEDYQDVIRDVGFYASIKGYDAIATNGALGHDYVVLLNRTKAVVKE